MMVFRLMIINKLINYSFIKKRKEKKRRYKHNVTVS